MMCECSEGCANGAVAEVIVYTDYEPTNHMLCQECIDAECNGMIEFPFDVWHKEPHELPQPHNPDQSFTPTRGARPLP